MISAVINGKTSEHPEGTTILEAARTAGIEIPGLCNDSRLKPCGACRVCLVEVNGSSRLQVSCSTELKGGMEISTETPALREARRMNLRMLARRYPADAFEDFPDKPFHKLAREYGLTKEDFLGEYDPTLLDESHPYIRVEMSRCIDCYRCVRICDEVQGQFVWQVAGMGQSTRIVPDTGTRFSESSCVSCGACVDTCPTGALEDKSLLERGSVTNWTKTVCPYCGTGCEMYAGTRNDKLVQIKPAIEAPVSSGHLCIKGRYAFDFVDAADRITEPMIRTSGEWKQVSWKEAIDFTADRLKEIISRNGRQSVGVLGSARATNEENYLAQKFARVVIGTNNVDCCARVCHTPSAAAMKLMLGTGAATNSFDDIELAQTILICGANPTENHPIVGERIKQAVLRNGAHLIVIDPRKIELAKYADLHLQLRPGTNVPLLNSIAYTIIEEGLYDKEFLDARVLEFDEFRSFLQEYSPEAVASQCGVEAALIRQAAKMYAAQGPSMCFHGLGVTEHTQGTEGVMCLINLALLTGNMGKRGSGINPLRGQNNVQGSAQMGCDPGILTGSISIRDARERFESVWKEPIPTERGLDAMRMIDAAREGKLKALWAIGYDVFFSTANANKTEAAMRSLELVIIQDIFMNETASAFGHVFFPAASSFEKDGTFMNSERRIQRVRKAIEPRGSSRSDWEIICDLAAAMGHERSFKFSSAAEIWNEIRSVWNGAAGISYERLDEGGLQWPCLDEDDPGLEVLHKNSFAHDPRAALRRIAFRPTTETVNDEFPILLSTGRTLCHFNAGTMTWRTRNTEIHPTDFLFLHPEDARELSLQDGEPVCLESRWGKAVLPLKKSMSIRRGEAFATFHDPKVFLNRLTGPNRDSIVRSPEYKVTAIRVAQVREDTPNEDKCQN